MLPVRPRPADDEGAGWIDEGPHHLEVRHAAPTGCQRTYAIDRVGWLAVDLQLRHRDDVVRVCANGRADRFEALGITSPQRHSAPSILSPEIQYSSPVAIS